MTPDSYARIDAAVKIIGLAFVVISGSFALWQYHYAQEREFKKVFFEKQLEVVTEVFDVLAEMDAAKTDEERKSAAAKFWIIYQGKGRAFLDSKMFQALEFPAEYVSGCVVKVRKPSTISCENFSASMSAPGFANVAREQMSQVWSLSFSAIAKEDPWLPPAK
jgi:hypothetical protein